MAPYGTHGNSYKIFLITLAPYQYSRNWQLQKCKKQNPQARFASQQTAYACVRPKSTVPLRLTPPSLPPNAPRRRRACGSWAGIFSTTFLEIEQVFAGAMSFFV